MLTLLVVDVRETPFISVRADVCFCARMTDQGKNNGGCFYFISYSTSHEVYTKYKCLYGSLCVSAAGFRSQRGAGGCLTLPSVPSGEVGQ